MLTTSSELSDRYACVYMHIAHLIQSTINFTIIWDKSMPISTLTCMSDNFCRSSRYIVNPFLCTIDWEGNLRNWICTYRKKGSLGVEIRFINVLFVKWLGLFCHVMDTLYSVCLHELCSSKLRVTICTIMNV